METVGAIVPLVLWGGIILGAVWLVVRALKKKNN